MTIQNVLKELYYSLGGSADTVRDTDDVYLIIKAIADLNIGDAIKAAGAPQLPEVEKTDAGKVLTVSNKGEWEAADLPA